MKPQGYMNCSGEAVAEWIRYYKILAEEILVIVDDVSLVLGTLRLRGSGSCGGHNGLRSVEEALGSDQYARLRCGVGPCQEGRALEVFVLERFSEVERPITERMVKRAAEAVRCCQTETMEIAMNTFNRKMEEV
jgi:PTH1 family peptidyl-tRNA hydrolase